MNHIYRLVFNRALGVVQVVSELASASPGGRNAAAAHGLQRTPLALACAGLLGATGLFAALPAAAATCVPDATHICGTDGGAGSGTTGGTGSTAGTNNGGAGGAGFTDGADGQGPAGSAGAGGLVNGGGGGGGGGGIANGGLGGGGGGAAAYNDQGGGGGGGGGIALTIGATITNTNTVAGGNGGRGADGNDVGNNASGGGGGGGGSGGVVSTANVTLTNTATGDVLGGDGGDGGDITQSNSFAGNGGGGGSGLVVLATGVDLLNSGAIRGGNGGNGGIDRDGDTNGNGIRGSGGGGGAGIAGGNFSLTNSGTIAGGDGGSTSGPYVTQGAGGAGIVVTGNTTLNNSGAISGGLGGNGVTRAAAILFGGTGNTLNLLTGSSLVGNLELAANAGATIAGQNAGLALGNNIVLGNASNLGFDTSTAGLNVTGTINGAGNVAISGSNALSLSTVNVASLQQAAGNALTLNGNVTTTGAQDYDGIVTLGANVTLASTGSGNIAFGSTLDGAHALTVTTGGAANFGGAIGGTTALTGLTVTSGTFSTAGDVTINGPLSVTTTSTITQTSGVFTVAGTSTFDAGASAITLTNAGNSFGGTVNLTGGTTQITNSGNLTLGSLNTGALTATSFGALNLGAGTITGNLSATSNGGVTGQSGALRVTGNSTIDAGANAITLTNAGNDFGGTVTATGSNIAIIDSNTLTTLAVSGSGPVSLTGISGLTLGGDVSTPGSVTLASSAGGITQTGGILTTGSLAGNAAGDVGLTGLNQIAALGNFSAANFSLTNAQALAITGTLAASGNVVLTDTFGITVTGAINAASTTLANGTMLQIGNGGTTGSITGNVVDNGILAFDRSDALTFAGAISGSGSLQQLGTGTLVLTGSNSYGGGTTISAGTLRVGDGGTTGSITGNVVDNGILAFDRSDALTFAGSITGSGGLQQLGSGTLILDGNSSAFAGSTEVMSGGLIVGGTAGNGAALGGDVDVASGATLGGHGSIGGDVSLVGGAHLAPGNSIGTLTIGGDLSLAQGSVLDFEFGAPGADFATFGAGDNVVVGGDLSLDGAVLNVTDAGGMGPGLYNLFGWGGTLSQSNGGLVFGALPVGNFQLQTLTGDRQINLIDSTGVTLDFWNGNGLASATQLGGGDGTWSTTSMTWTDATGSVTAAMQPQPGFAIFGGAAGTVTIDDGSGAVSATGMQFASDGYVLDGDTLTLVADGGATPIIRVGDGSSTGAGFTATIDNVIAGSDGLAKTDLGMLVLTGTNTYSGGTTVNGGTLEVAGNAALGSGSVTVDNSANQAATLKVDSGITLANVIALNNGGTLDNAGTLSHTGTSEIGVVANGGMATVTNHDGGRIAGDSIGLWLITGGTVVNSGGASRIEGAGYALVTDGSPDSVVTNENGASIHGGTYDSILMIQGGTLINQSGASISGDSVAVRMSQSGTITNQGGASISGTGAGSYGVILHQGGTITNQGGATIQGGASGIALAGASTINNAAGSSIIGGNTSVSVFGSGAVNLTNAGTLIGDVALDAGALNAVTLFSGSTLRGGLHIGSNSASTLALEGSGTQLYSDAVTGVTTFSGALTKDGNGTWVLDRDLATAGITIADGTLQVGAGGTTGAISGDVANDATLAFDRSDDIAFSGAISGSGALVQQGNGMLTLDGDSSAFAGSTDVQSGSVIVGSVAGNGAALGGDVDVASGAALGGHGSIGGDVVNAGTLAPGASIGTLTIHGDYTQTATGTLAIEADASGQADLLVVDGVATLDGSTLVLAQSGNWMPRTDYTILTAGGGVNGEFDSATSSLLFLDPILGYGANAVTLSLQRNDIAFESAARTRNQRATAAAADGLDWGNAAYVALTALDADSAPQAFDALSGEVHASARTALLDDSRYLREAINRHLQVTDNGAAGAWTAAWGHWARSDSDGNADAMRGDALGFAIGADIAIADRARVGAVIGTGQLTTRADARASVVDIDSRHLGLYGSIQVGGLLLQGGAAHSRQQAGSKRIVAFGGYADLTQADYDARTTQVYLDGSHAFAFNRGSLAPFLNLAQVKVRSEAFDETGGDAALHVDAASSERTYATVGARWTAAFGSQDAVQWQGSVGWMHAFGGDDVPLNDARFLTGSDTFTIAGTPLADNAFALDAGLRWQADPQVVIDAGYVGRFASDVRDQGARVTLNWTF